MRISLVTITYPPEIGGAAHLIHGLATRLVEMGHQVTIVTCYPTYNLKEIPRQYRRGFRMTESVDGITVERIHVPRFSRTSLLARGFEHFAYAFYLGAVTLFMQKPDVTLVFSPPLPLPWVIEAVGRVRGMPVIVNIQDLFPLEAVELGMLTNKVLIRVFEWMERQVYRQAAAVTVHSPGNREHVVERGGLPSRVQVVYNWVDTELIHPSPKRNSFSQQYGLENKFIVSYAGTMGWAQDMNTIVACAERLKDHPDILFLMVGDGVEREKAQTRSVELGLANIVWLPMQPLSVYPDILAASDISMINLHPELRTPVVPSKLLSIMSAGRPVVASLPKESDARGIIKDARCGLCVDAGDDAALAGAISHLAAANGLLTEMGSNGRNYIESHFSRQVCTEVMAKVLVDAKGAVG